MKVLGFDNVFLPVGDLEAAVTFYRDVVGLPVHRRFDAMGSALFSVGSETPGLGVGVAEFPASGERPTPDGAPGFAATKVWFEVPDARAAADELTGLGVEPITPPFEIPTGWTFEIRDPWGNILGFTDYTRRQELARSDSPESSTS